MIETMQVPERAKPTVGIRGLRRARVESRRSSETVRTSRSLDGRSLGPLWITGFRDLSVKTFHFGSFIRTTITDQYCCKACVTGTRNHGITTSLETRILLVVAR